MNIDWSKAPEGATHYKADEKCWATGGVQFYRRIDWETWEFWGQLTGALWHECGVCPDTDLLIERPSQWGGEGIPPVGTVCEICLVTNNWVKVVVVAITEYRIYCEQVEFWDGYAGPAGYDPIKKSARFRPIKTPERIAEEKREKGISELLAVALTAEPNSRDVCSAIYDAGYRKFEIVEEDV